MFYSEEDILPLGALLIALTASARGLLATWRPFTETSRSPGARRPCAAAAPPATTDRTTITELPASAGS